MADNSLLPIKLISNTETANAFLFGLIFNQNQKAERAWRAPYMLKARLGTLKPMELSQLPRPALIEAISTRPALHPFAAAMAGYISGSCNLLLEKYKGDARRIWLPAISVGEALRRLRELPGIGEHKAVVGVFLLREVLHVSFNDDGTRLDVKSVCPGLYRLYRGGDLE